MAHILCSPGIDRLRRDLSRAVAQDSYPLPDFLAPALHAVLRLTLDHFRFLERQKAAYTRLIKDELACLPEADLALAKPGLGAILVAGCLSEIQDTRRFVTGLKYDRRRKRMRPRAYRDPVPGPSPGWLACSGRATAPAALRARTAA